MAAKFKTTRWSLVLQAGEPASPQFRAALDQLCRDYERPVREVVRAWTAWDEAQASEAVQDFLVTLLQRGVLPEDGSQRRFRTWIVERAWRHFRAGAEGAPRAFDGAWALTVVERASAKLDQSSLARSMPEAYAFARKVLAGRAPSYAHAAGELGVQEHALREYVLRCRTRLCRLVREEVAQLVSDEAELQEELSLLVASLSAEASC